MWSGPLRLRAPILDSSELCGSSRNRPDGLEYFTTGICLPKVSREAHRFGCCVRFRVVVSGYEDDGSMPAYRCKPLRQFDARYSFELDVEHEAPELRLLDVSEECFR